MNTITIEQLQDMGQRSTTLRWYLWFKHFVEVGPLDIADYFLGKLYRRGSVLPETWSDLLLELDAAKAKG